MAGAYDIAADALRVRNVDTGGNTANTKAQQQELTPITAVGASGAAVTLTIPAPGAGISNYLQYLQVVAYAATAVTAGSTPITVTTTNLNGVALTLPTALPLGAVAEQKYEGGAPIKAAAAATTITIVCPATTGVIWRVNAAYFQGA